MSGILIMRALSVYALLKPSVYELKPAFLSEQSVSPQQVTYICKLIHVSRFHIIAIGVPRQKFWDQIIDSE